MKIDPNKITFDMNYTKNLTRVKNIALQNFDHLAKYQTVPEFRRYIRPEKVAVVYYNNVIIGFMSYNDQRYWTNRIFIHLFAISPLYQKHNIGSLFIKEFIKTYHDTTINLLATNHDIAEKFYVKNGFTLKGYVKGSLSDSCADLYYYPPAKEHLDEMAI